MKYPIAAAMAALAFNISSQGQHGNRLANPLRMHSPKLYGRMPVLLLILLTSLCGLVTAQSGPFLVSTPETSKDGLQVFVKEDSGGERELQIYVPAGGNIGRRPESIRAEDLTARAFDESGKELGLTDANFNGDTLIAVCNAGACSAIKMYNFSVPKTETDRVRKVVVMFRNKRYELTMEKYPRPKN